MNKVYVIVDQFGYIGSYDSKEKADKIINYWEDQVDLMLLSFPVNEKLPLDKVYFLPYRGHETDNKFPVALVSNDKNYILKVQKKMVSMDLTYPDKIFFFTKKINTIEPVEYSRLTDKKLRYKEDFVDQILTKINEADDEDLAKPFGEMMAGIVLGPYNILNEEGGYLQSKSEE